MEVDNIKAQLADEIGTATFYTGGKRRTYILNKGKLRTPQQINRGIA
jgi:hypothetical protein